MEEIDRRKFIKTTVLTGLVGSASIPLLGKIPVIKENSSLRFNIPDSKEIDWLKVRESFPLRKEVHYFNTASLGPSPMLLIDNLRLNTLNFETRAATGRQHFKNVRVQMAQYLFCDPDEIAFTRNVTEGINIAARSLNLKEGDEVVITDNEHVGGILPWMAIAKGKGVTIKVIDLDVTGENVVSQFEEAITSKTKVVFFSHVLCTTGMVLPAKEIASLCKSKGVVSCIDGAQALGMISVDLKDIDPDFYFGCGHKWLLGLEGTGVLFINKKTIEKINPFYAGAYTSESFDLKSNQLEYRNVAEREEYGTRNVPLIQSLSDSLDFMGEI